MADDRQRQRQDDDTPERAIVLVDRLNQALSVQMQPLMAELAETRRQLVDLARENGALRAELDAVRHWHVTGTATDIPFTTASADRHVAHGSKETSLIHDDSMKSHTAPPQPAPDVAEWRRLTYTGWLRRFWVP